MSKHNNKKLVLQGLKDIYSDDEILWQAIKEIVRKTAADYNFTSLELPFLESNQLYRKFYTGKDGDESLVSFSDGKRKVSLRSDLRTGLHRAYLDNNMLEGPQPVRLFSEGLVYSRQENGDFDENYVFDFDMIGSEKHLAENLLIETGHEILKRLKLKDIKVEINSMGNQCCEPAFKKALLRFVSDNKKAFSDIGRKKIKENPYEVFNFSETDILKDAPKVSEYLCEECKKQLKLIERGLRESKIEYQHNSYLFINTGLANNTMFRILAEGKVLMEGNRFDGLIKLIDSKHSVPSVGASIKLNVLSELLKEKKISLASQKKKPLVFLAHLGETARLKIMKHFTDLLNIGVEVKESIMRESLRSQLNIAERFNLKWLLILGQKEALDGTIIVKEMKSGVQEIIPWGKFLKRIEMNKNYLM